MSMKSYSDLHLTVPSDDYCFILITITFQVDGFGLNIKWSAAGLLSDSHVKLRQMGQSLTHTD